MGTEKVTIATASTCLVCLFFLINLFNFIINRLKARVILAVLEQVLAFVKVKQQIAFIVRYPSFLAWFTDLILKMLQNMIFCEQKIKCFAQIFTVMFCILVCVFAIF